MAAVSPNVPAGLETLNQNSLELNEKIREVKLSNLVGKIQLETALRTPLKLAVLLIAASVKTG